MEIGRRAGGRGSSAPRSAAADTGITLPPIEVCGQRDGNPTLPPGCPPGATVCYQPPPPPPPGDPNNPMFDPPGNNPQPKPQPQPAESDDFVLPKCGDAAWGFAKSLAGDALVPLRFLNDLRRISQGGYVVLKYGRRAASLASGYRVAGALEAGGSAALYLMNLPDGGMSLYDLAKAVPVLGSGLRLGETIDSCLGVS